MVVVVVLELHGYGTLMALFEVGLWIPSRSWKLLFLDIIRHQCSPGRVRAVRQGGVVTMRRRWNSEEWYGLLCKSNSRNQNRVCENALEACAPLITMCTADGPG